MATPSYAHVIDQINTYIVANGNNEITANVLNPILEIITDFANNHMGDLDNLTTDETDTLVDAINSLKQNINDIVGNSVQLHIGNANPNDVPPSTYNYGDFFMQLSPLDNEPIQLWQFNGFEWFAPDAATSWGDIEGNIADQTDLQEALDLKADVTDLEDYQLLSEKGEANGYTPLDSAAKVPMSFLPDSLVGQVTYQGTWNASTNTPNVGDATTKKGYYYVTSTSGTYLGITYEVGDWIISNGVEWQKVDNTDAVTTVFGRIGPIVANSSDYAAYYSPIITGGASTIVTYNLTANRALLSNGSGKVSVSTVTNTELGYVGGVTSPIQTQLNAKLASSSYTAADVLTKLLTVDGSGSGLDADLLRGVHWGNVNTNIVTSGSIFSSNPSTAGDASGVLELSASWNSGTYDLNTSPLGVIDFKSNYGGNATGVWASIRALAAGTYSNSGNLRPSKLCFYTTPDTAGGVLTEVMRINSGGNVSIGNTNNTYKLDVSGTGRLTGDLLLGNNALGVKYRSQNTVGGYIEIGVTPNVTSRGFINFTNGLDIGGNINISGTGTFTSTVTATNFILSSDERLKSNIKPIGDIWREFEMDGVKRYGVIAQEIEKTNPELVHTNEEGFKSVAYIDLLCKEMAEKDKRIQELESRLKKLEKHLKL